MKRLSRPCLDCGVLSPESRCPDHRRSLRQAQRNPIYDHPAYRRARDRMLSEHRRLYGEWCPGAPERGHVPHWCERDNPLTIDHFISLSEGGHPFDPANLRVVCLDGNVAKGGANRRRGEGGHR